ncbi:DNA mismatch endonuclease Vsr [Candidatus Parcubacteria bacterium]|nr:DNA mismatch endonuclease Vsr [Candidatus Parcubacteria bacterium]
MKKKTNNYLNRNFKKKRSDDPLSVGERSDRMSKIRSRGTKFEADFVTILKKKTRKKFELNVKEIKGKPDIVFMRSKVCVFLDSDFWHGWQFPRWKHLLKNDFWVDKIDRNRKRDQEVKRYLTARGWKVIRIWEHEIKKDVNQSIKKILKELK